MKLGNLIDKAGLTKSNLKEAAKLGAGAGVFPFVYGIIQSQGLLRLSPQMFAQNTPGEYAARALSGVVLGSLTSRLLKMPSVGDGMVAAAVGTVVKDLIAPYLNPAAAAAQSAVRAAEQAGQDQMSDVNPLGRGLAGLGAMLMSSQPLLFGVGTPDTSAASMLNGATVAIEPSSNFAGAFTH